MSYKAALTRNFLRELKRLPDDIRDRIFRIVDEMLANPFSGVKLRGELEGRWRWRVGKYRIIYIIDQEERLVVLLDVGLRKAVYE